MARIRNELSFYTHIHTCRHRATYVTCLVSRSCKSRSIVPWPIYSCRGHRELADDAVGFVHTSSGGGGGSCFCPVIACSQPMVIWCGGGHLYLFCFCMFVCSSNPTWDTFGFLLTLAYLKIIHFVFFFLLFIDFICGN